MTTTKPRLTGIIRSHGSCDACSREIGRVFVVEVDGEERTYGRRCAAKVTGYAPNLVEREAQAAARMAELEARRAIVRAERPGLEDANLYVFEQCAVEDSWWGGAGWTAYDTWQDYADAQAAGVAA